MRYLGQWQERLENVVADLANIDGILAVENLLELVAIGGREPRDSLAAFLMPYIRGGRCAWLRKPRRQSWMLVGDYCRAWWIPCLKLRSNR